MLTSRYIVFSLGGGSGLLHHRCLDEEAGRSASKGAKEPGRSLHNRQSSDQYETRNEKYNLLQTQESPEMLYM